MNNINLTVNIPNEEEMVAMKNVKERTPTSLSLDTETQKRVLEEISNANIPNNIFGVITEYADFKGTELCPHCDNEFEYIIKENLHFANCPKCDKTIPLCSRCEKNDAGNCADCIYCDTANFINYLRGKVTLHMFLNSLNPPIKDLSKSLDPNIDLSYDNYMNCDLDDKVVWDERYWSIYQYIIESMITIDTAESDIISFVETIIEKNHQK